MIKSCQNSHRIAQEFNVRVKRLKASKEKLDTIWSVNDKLVINTNFKYTGLGRSSKDIEEFHISRLFLE